MNWIVWSNKDLFLKAFPIENLWEWHYSPFLCSCSSSAPYSTPHLFWRSCIKTTYKADLQHCKMHFSDFIPQASSHFHYRCGWVTDRLTRCGASSSVPLAKCIALGCVSGCIALGCVSLGALPGIQWSEHDISWRGRSWSSWSRRSQGLSRPLNSLSGCVFTHVTYKTQRPVWDSLRLPFLTTPGWESPWPILRKKR